MRLCCAIPCFFGNSDFSDSIKRAAALGFDAVETYKWEHLDLPKVKETLDECNVELISMCTTEWRMTTPEHRGLWLEGLEKSCRAAKFLGAKRLITQVGKDTGAPRELQHESIRDALIAARPILDEYGVTIMPEPLNTYVNHPGYYLWSSREAFDIIREVDHPHVKLIYDIYHQQVMEGNIVPSVTQNLDLIAHLHCAAHPGRIEPWLGESNYEFIFDAIDAAGYTGACGLEYKPTLPPEESLKQALFRYGKKNKT
jgi:hydroxypyruvate isomerase